MQLHIVIDEIYNELFSEQYLSWSLIMAVGFYICVILRRPTSQNNQRPSCGRLLKHRGKLRLFQTVSNPIPPIFVRASHVKQ
jgi:hypothetical protein